MTLIIRSASDFEPGDRVYDADTKLIRLFEGYSKHQFSKGFLHFEDHKYSYHPQPYHMANRRFLRVIEVGEIIPKGAITQVVMLGGLGPEKIENESYEAYDTQDIRVLVSLPEPAEDEIPQNDECLALNPCFVCGHDKKMHIYHEGACRPGFVCEHHCKKFVSCEEQDDRADWKRGVLLSTSNDAVSQFDLVGELEAANKLIRTLEGKLKKSRIDHADLKQRNRELSALNKVLEDQSSKASVPGVPDFVNQSVPSEPIQTGTTISDDVRDAFKDALAATPYCNLACGNEQPSPDALLQAAATIYATAPHSSRFETSRKAWAVDEARELADLITQTKANT